MAVIEIAHSVHKYIGASTDTKPTAVTAGTTAGSTFYEQDTGIMYITYDGTTWVEKDTIVRLETSPTIDIGDVTLLAGTASIGKLAANSGVDIGDVDVLSIAAGNNNIGDVDVASIAAGTTRIGTVSGVLKTVSLTKTLVAATQYHATDVLSESATNTAGTSWLFAAIGRANGASGYITKAQVISETTALTPRLVLYLFNAVPTCELDDHATNTCPLYADEAGYIGKIEFPAMSETGVAASHAIATPSTYGNLPLEFDCAAAADDLYGVLITLDAFTQGVGDDMVVKLTAEQY